MVPSAQGAPGSFSCSWASVSAASRASVSARDCWPRAMAVERTFAVAGEPVVVHGMDGLHDLGQFAAGAIGVLREADGVGVAGDMAADHSVEVALYTSKVDEVVLRAPEIGRVVLARRRRAVDVCIGERGVGFEEPGAARVECNLDFGAVHWEPPNRFHRKDAEGAKVRRALSHGGTDVFSGLLCGHDTVLRNHC